MTQSHQAYPNALQNLEEKLHQLITLYHEVSQENSLLKKQNNELVLEKNELLEKTSLAKSRVETIISKLKTLE